MKSRATRMLKACEFSYEGPATNPHPEIGYVAPPQAVERARSGDKIDYAIVGRIPEGMLIAFRGTIDPRKFVEPGMADDVLRDWRNNFDALPVKRDGFPGEVHGGFHKSFKALVTPDADGKSLTSLVVTQLAASPAKAIWITGHSKGGALANLAAWHFAHLEGVVPTNIRVRTFGAPRVGTAGFREAWQALPINAVRFETPGDLVPHLPPGIDIAEGTLNALKIAQLTAFPKDRGYVHIGPKFNSPLELMSLANLQFDGLLPKPLRDLAKFNFISEHLINQGSHYAALAASAD